MNDPMNEKTNDKTRNGNDTSSLVVRAPFQGNPRYPGVPERLLATPPFRARVHSKQSQDKQPIMNNLSRKSLQNQGVFKNHLNFWAELLLKIELSVVKKHRIHNLLR
jgi:hypothetical protein